MALSNDEYLQAQATIGIMAGAAAELDIDEFIRRIDLSETMGIFAMSPIEYQKGTKDIKGIKALAEAIQPFCKEARRQKKMVEEHHCNLLSGNGRH